MPQMSGGCPHILGGEASEDEQQQQQRQQYGDATRRRASMDFPAAPPSILLPSSNNKQQRRASMGDAPTQPGAHHHERRVSFSGTYRVREYQIGPAELQMKQQARRDSNQAKRQMRQERADRLAREQAGEERMWMMGIDLDLHVGDRATSSAMVSADDIGRLSDQIARASLPAWTRSASAGGEDHADPTGAVVDDPLSAERVVSSLFTSLLDTTASSSSSGGEPKHMRRSSYDGTAASSSNINGHTLPPSPRAVNQRRSSLELWSAHSKVWQRRASATDTASAAANPRLMEGLAQLRLMSAASRRLSASAAAPTTGGAASEPPPPSFTVPLKDGGNRRRSITTTSRRHSLEHKEIVIIDGKRIQRRASMARRRTSLEMEDELNVADALAMDDVLMGRQPTASSAQTSRRSQPQLVWMDPETRRDAVRADAGRARAARRRHSIGLAPCYGGFHVETTFSNDNNGAPGLRRTRSFDGSVLPSAISAKKKMLSERGRSNDTNIRKSEGDSVGTPDTDPSSNELTLDDTRVRDGEDNSACPTASSSCIAVGASVAVRRGSQTKLEDTASKAPHAPPLNITCIRQRRRPSSVAPTAKPDPRQRRSSDSDIGRPHARRTSTGSSRNLPRRLSSQGPQQQDKSGRDDRGTQNQQKQKQKQQHQKQLALALSGANSQSRRRSSMDALAKNSFLSWHRQEKHEEADARHGTSSARMA